MDQKRYCCGVAFSILKEMATHSSILAWRIPWTEELGRLQSMGHKELDTTEWLNTHHVPDNVLEVGDSAKKQQGKNMVSQSWHSSWGDKSRANKENMHMVCKNLIGSVVSDSLWPQGLQHARLPCPSPSPGVCSNSGPLSRYCHPTISSSVIPFSSCPQSLPASGCFPMSRLFASGGQSIRTSASPSVCPMNIQDWFPLGFTGLISLLSKELSRVFSSTTIWKHLYTP